MCIQPFMKTIKPRAIRRMHDAASDRISLFVSTLHKVGVHPPHLVPGKWEDTPFHFSDCIRQFNRPPSRYERLTAEARKTSMPRRPMYSSKHLSSKIEW